MAVTGYVRSSRSFDAVLASEQLECLKHILLHLGADAFYKQFITILRKKPEGTKEESGAWNKRLVPYRMNRMQADMRDTFGPSIDWVSIGEAAGVFGPRRNITLKWRQGGATTHHIIDRLYVPTILTPGTNGLLISQSNKRAAEHLAILKRAHKYFGRRNPFMAEQIAENPGIDFHAHLLHTKYHDKRSLVFDFLDSTVGVESAEVEEAGQGITLHRVVCSEVSRWPGNPEETLANMKEAIVPDGTLDIECTPNGMGGYFFEEWQRAKNWPSAEFRAHFYPWWWAEDCEEDTQIAEEELTEEERTLAQAVQLTLRNIQWRRGKILALRHNFDEKYPEDDIKAFLSSGRMFFDVQIMRELKLARMHEQPLEVHSNGEYQVFRRRIPNRRYIIGADCAEGKLISTDNSDFNDAVVLDLDTGEEVAAYRSRIPPEDFANDLANIGASFNGAMIAVERNGPGGTVIYALERQIMYPNIYYFPDRDFLKEKKSGQKQVIRMAGFPTRDNTRRFALNELARLLRNQPELWHAKHFIDECLTFSYNEKGKPEAITGAHDDAVLARAVACAARAETLGFWDPHEAGREDYGDTGEEAA